MKKIKYTYDDTWFLQAALDKIKAELDRINFNIHQKEMPSPFENTGVIYSNDTFTVRAYNWNENELPNFEYKDLKVWWYKHCDRGLYAEGGHKLNYDDVNQMIIDCCKSIQNNWEDNNEN